MSGEVITVVELLSPTNKRPGEGRRKYEAKRLAVLGSRTHLVEIDLIRPMSRCLSMATATTRITVSLSAAATAGLRPICMASTSKIHPDLLPSTAPRRRGAACDCGLFAACLYDRAGYDLSVDYRRDPVPAFQGEDAAWVVTLLEPWRQGKA